MYFCTNQRQLEKLTLFQRTNYLEIKKQKKFHLVM